MIEFYWPSSTGELLAFSSAAVTLIFGLMLLVIPRRSLNVLRLQTAPAHPEAVSEARGTMAGFYLGSALSAMLLAQPLIYLVLGAGWAFTAFGRLVSIVFDRGFTTYNLVSVLIEAALAAAPLLYAFSMM